MEKFYCVRCKQSYETDDYDIVETSNKKKMLVAYHDCGTKGTKFSK